MAGVVDRLLAQLPGLQQSGRGAPRDDIPRPIQHSFVSTTSSGSATANPGEALGAWIRLILALSLGMMMAGWPYLRSCGLPLLGYLAAVGTVMWAGAWAAMAAWRSRSALAHVLSLAVILYGLLLSLAEFLPRTGYATHHATWQCAESTLTSFLASNPSSN
jgi:hypothetical protein